jgi:hypothetical protein
MNGKQGSMHILKKHRSIKTSPLYFLVLKKNKTCMGGGGHFPALLLFKSIYVHTFSVQFD